MSGLVVCPVCREIAEKKNRPMKQGDCAYVEMKRVPGGVGGYCGKCTGFGYDTTIHQVETPNPKTGEIRIKYRYVTNYPDYPKPSESVKDGAAEYETLFNQLYDELGVKIVSEVMDAIGERRTEDADKIKEMVEGLVKEAIDETEIRRRGRPKKEE